MAEVGELFAPLRSFPTLVLAVSGGADSIALMHLVVDWSQQTESGDRRIVVATVDHGLREGSRTEAEWVAEQARLRGLEHRTLIWEGAKPETGVQEAARAARYRLLADHVAGVGGAPAAIVTAHTEDDQAETLLMRLARGSGLDGLAGMSAMRPLGGHADCVLARPLLSVPHARLEATLRSRGLPWLEDPSNASDRFERVRVRKAQAALASLGLTNDKLALSARRLERSRRVLDAATEALHHEVGLDLHGGAYASLATAAFTAAPEDLRLRLLGRLIAAFGGQDEPVRMTKVEALVARLSEPGFDGATLGGAIVTRHGNEIQLFREPGRTSLPEIALAPGAPAVWDGRFRVCAGAGAGSVTVRALGAEAFAGLRNTLSGKLPPARAAATVPSFWREGRILAIPLLAGIRGAPSEWTTGPAQHCSAEFLW